MQQTMLRMAAGTHKGTEEHRLARHARRCHDCRRRAREMGIEPLTTLGTLRQKAAALLPIPWLFRRSGDAGGTITGLFSTGANAAPLAERAAALVAAAALVGAGGAALGGGVLHENRATAGEDRPAAGHSATFKGESQRGTAGLATDGERAGARRASGRKAGPAGGRAGGSDDRLTGAPDGADSTGGPGAGGPADALPKLPDATPHGATPPSAPDPSSINLPAPRVAPQVDPLPKVELPPVDVEVPNAGELTGGLQNALP